MAGTSPAMTAAGRALPRDFREIGDGVHRLAQFVQESQAVQPQLGVVGVDRHVEEESVDRRAQGRERPHRALEILARRPLARRRARRGEGVGEVLFGRQREEGRIMRAGESFRAVLFLLGAQDVGGAAIAGEQVLAVLGVEQLAQRLDPADDEKEVVLARQREYGVDEIVPRALVAQVDFQAVGEEGEEVGQILLARI